ETPSPTGDTEYAVSLIEGELIAMGMSGSRTRKGALVARLEGFQRDRPRALVVHVDTLGAIVSRVKPSGRLGLSALNGLIWATVESEGVTIATSGGRQVRGSLVLANGSGHVNSAARDGKRDDTTMEVRLDERTSTAEETRLLGVEVGDFIYFDPRVEVSDSGYIRSRFLDNKAGVACLVAAVKALKEVDLTPAQDVTLLFGVHEEVGHGVFEVMPSDLAELVVVDMGCIGEGLNGSETTCSLCVKDAAGPYSRGLIGKLAGIADRRGIELARDVYPFYSSDGSAYWRAGGGSEVALIGPGVDTSHGYERTHIDALVDTAQLIAEYLIED
ncbi:MAG: peptidase M42, partial [Armatimonadota bacterium]